MCVKGPTAARYLNGIRLVCPYINRLAKEFTKRKKKNRLKYMYVGTNMSCTLVVRRTNHHTSLSRCSSLLVAVGMWSARPLPIFFSFSPTATALRCHHTKRVNDDQTGESSSFFRAPAPAFLSSRAS